MAIFWNIFLKTFSIFFSISLLISIFTLSLSLIDRDNDNFLFHSGEKDSSNIIALIEINGLIINYDQEFSKLTTPFSISPENIKNYLNELTEISPNIIIFSINSPGGTVSASKELYEIIKDFKKNNNSEILFHTNQLLASGGYWVSTSADKIYANYGSIIGSIGVKGPDWFFYDNPKSISTGIFGNKIETIDGIQIFSNTAGKSKDIFNPFRAPTNIEIDHLQNMVNEIYNDFIRIISKERKIETKNLINDIGALIYSSKKAEEINLIDGVISLENLIKKTINEKDYQSYQIIKSSNNKKSLFRQILSVNFFKNYIINNNLNINCLTLKTSISSILSYESVGC